MSAVAKPQPPAKSTHRGPLDWRLLVEWLSQDGVISTDEARRTVARCSQAESAQHPLVRLAAVAMARASDGKPLDIETLTQWLAGRAGLDYLRIDPAQGRRRQGRRHHERRLCRAPQACCRCR